MIAGISSANLSTELSSALTAPVRRLPFIPSDFAPTASSAGTIVEMQAVVNIKPRPEATTQSVAQQQLLEVLA